MNNRMRSRFFDIAIVRSSRSMRFTGRKLDMCSTRNSSVMPSSRRTSSRLRFGLFGVKKFGMTSIDRFRRKVSCVWFRRLSETAVTASECTRACSMAVR